MAKSEVLEAKKFVVESLGGKVKALPDKSSEDTFVGEFLSKLPPQKRYKFLEGVAREKSRMRELERKTKKGQS